MSTDRPMFPYGNEKWTEGRACPECGEDGGLYLWADVPQCWHLYPAQDGSADVLFDSMGPSHEEASPRDGLDLRIECSSCWTEWAAPHRLKPS